MIDQVDVLDHGYVKLIDSWGRLSVEEAVGDEVFVAAARMSTDKGFQGWGDETKAGDEKLLAYLYNHKHMSPFEMGGATFEVQAPIFVFREWVRHRTLSLNELSARYAPLPDVNFVPTVARIIGTDEPVSSNKQAGTLAGLPRVQEQLIAERWRASLKVMYEQCEQVYQQGLVLGIPKELARSIVPVGRYSRMRVSANFRNWLAFLALRNDAAAQTEIREYAIVIQKMLAELFPRTVALFTASL